MSFKLGLILKMSAFAACLATHTLAQAILFEEFFEDNNFESRGWYGSTELNLSSTEYVTGSTQSVEYRFLKGATLPESRAAIRRQFDETESVYIRFYVKYSQNWQGSNKPYHPHEFYLTTNKNDDWVGPAYTYFTFYIEQNEGEPLVAFQDAMNINDTQIGENLTDFTESRALAGCNGDSDGHGNGDCYQWGSTFRNSKQWRAGDIYFSDDPLVNYKNTWHQIEVFVKLNSIAGGKGVADGILKYWYDGQEIISHNNIMFRTASHPDMMFNQFLIGPYIGDGSPVDQSFWIDNLLLAKQPLSASTIQPPQNIKITQ